VGGSVNRRHVVLIIENAEKVQVVQSEKLPTNQIATTLRGNRANGSLNKRKQGLYAGRELTIAEAKSLLTFQGGSRRISLRWLLKTTREEKGHREMENLNKNL